MNRPKFVRVPLHGTRGKNSFALVDVRDLPRVVEHRWFLVTNDSRIVYAGSSVMRNGIRTALLMHKLILPHLRRIDHKNGNGLDNRRHNLRKATEAQNQQNRKRLRNNTSGFKGVGWAKSRRKWRAMIRYSKVVFVGDFDTPEEAARAYDEAARKYHKKFARLNFPRRGEQKA